LGEELSYEEIAAVLGVPVGTVRSRLHNAVKKLREEMRE
jgi:RNA polymerase sigma-70 factor (ECF subfamily)